MRAIVEPFVIDLDDPASDRSDWGGPAGGELVRGGSRTVRWVVASSVPSTHHDGSRSGVTSASWSVTAA